MRYFEHEQSATSYEPRANDYEGGASGYEHK